MSTPPRIGLIVDNDAYFRMAMGGILESHFSCSQCIEVDSLDAALERLGERPDIALALFDLSAPGVRTPSNLRTVRECFPQTRVAVVSASNNRRNILLALEAGVHGYLLKTMDAPDMTAALKIILDGGIFVPASLADISSLPDDILDERLERPSGNGDEASARSPEKASPVSPLTPRQQDVLDLLVQGKTNKEIALALGLGEGTVKIHMAAIFRYFGVNNRAAAAVAGARPYPNRRRTLLSGV